MVEIVEIGCSLAGDFVIAIGNPHGVVIALQQLDFSRGKTTDLGEMMVVIPQIAGVDLGGLQRDKDRQWRFGCWIAGSISFPGRVLPQSSEQMAVKGTFTRTR